MDVNYRKLQADKNGEIMERIAVDDKYLNIIKL